MGGGPGHRRATELLREAGGRIRCATKDTCHWRGNFKALAQGIRYGTGMKKLGNACNTKHNALILDSLIKSEEFTHIASFTHSKLFYFKFLPNITNSPPHRLLLHLGPTPP